MELFLNLAWMLLATLTYWLWVSYAPRKGADRRTQLVALALVMLILFPVISVTDDLMTAQNPAETDCCQRKGHVHVNDHPMLHPVPEFALPSFAAIHSGSTCFAVPDNLTAPPVKVPALHSIQNRPPPAV
jgi:hypothetical protein